MFPSKNRGSDPDVFIIDDDEDLCDVMTWEMEKENLSVRTFHSGRGALSALKETSPAVIVLDFNLGDMNACEFLREKRAMLIDVPVILISGSPEEVKSSIPEQDFVLIVEKPLDLERLLCEVKKLSGPYSPRSSNEASRHSSHGPASAE